MTFRISKRFVLLNPLKTLFYGVTFFLLTLLIPYSAHAAFKDVKKETLYLPYIESLATHRLVSGDTDLKGNPNGYFRPYDQLNRVELAKLATIVRLAEKYGKKHDWDTLSTSEMEQELFELLKDFFNCDEGACKNIGGKPFNDVPQITNSNCVDSKIVTSSCTPWFTKFVYYAASKGFAKGYPPVPGKTQRRYGVEEPILRIHAIKMMVVDDGNIEPKKDDRYDDLSDRAADNKSYTPICLKGAENMILDLNGGNTPDAQKLLKYAILADRLDFFGMSCMLFTNEKLYTDAQRAQWLMQPITRQEAARWFALSTLYKPVIPDPEVDQTIASADENKGTDSAEKDYEIPEYKPTEFAKVVKKPEVEKVQKEEVPPKEEPGCELEYSVSSISNNAIHFTGSTDEQTVNITIDNISAQAWKKDCKFELIPDATWVSTKSQERTSRGFEWADRIDPLNVSGGKTAIVDSSGKKASFELKIKPTSASRSMQKFLVNGHVPGKGGGGIYVYGENAGMTPISRDFKTSVSGVYVRQQPVTGAYYIKKIDAANSSIKVTGHAVVGDYVDAYKTYMWYPVKVDEGDGFVLASLLHAEQLNGKKVDTDYGDTGVLWRGLAWSREKTLYYISSTNKCKENQIIGKNFVSKDLANVRGIVLHFTVGNSENSAAKEKDLFSDARAAHYVVDRSGLVAQTDPDYLAIAHAGYLYDQKCIRKDGNAFTIGIELPNWGVAVEKNGVYWNHKNEIMIDNWINIKNSFTEAWKVWNTNKNLAWGGELDNLSQETWQIYSEKQYEGLAHLIAYLEERYDLPHKFFYSGEASSEDVGLYFYPNQTEERNDYNNSLESFYGIYGHHNVTGKYDPGPQFSIEKLNHFYNQI